MRVAILGNGGFGTAMALTLERAGHDVSLWGHNPEYTAEIAATRQNPRYLAGVSLPASVRVGDDAGAALDGAGAVLVAVPTQHVRGVLTEMRGLLTGDAPVVSLAKGLEQSTGHRPSEILAEVLGSPERVYVLSGPSHAEEIAHGQPTTVVVAGDDSERLRGLQAALQTDRFRVYRNADLLGVELCGALKNVMALAAGIADGLGYGDNAKAAILSRGIVEMQRYGLACGADPQTFFGLAGVGDLAVTAFSKHGRNRAFGERIGRGETLKQALASSPKVAEGVWTAKVVDAASKQRGVEMPIAAAVAEVLYEELAPEQAVRALMERDPKAEGAPADS
ncbi:MAG: NAD(P)H-dependent glycerol-3-phosphate dehydrogenase [Planctomycetota bacterium]|nr:NAD(P)H-dependent glycerol-3-phosphate dehydrogenase [Planctomycetota bacterium]